ncbi:MAG: ABC transporter permease [Acidobacteriota bacterium]
MTGRRAGRPPWSAAVLVLLVGACLAAPLLAPHDPSAQPDSVSGRLRPPGTELHVIELARGDRLLADRVERTADGLRFERAGRWQELAADQVLNLTEGGVADRHVYWLGSDGFSRDVLSRWLYGGRLSMAIGLLAMLISAFLGVSLGALAALGGRWVDAALMRGVEALQTMPFFMLLIALRALLPTGAGTLILILGLSGWPTLARITRSEVLAMRDRDFVNAARGLGYSETRVFLRHVLPNVLTPLLVYATLIVGYLISVEAALSFLGLGVPVPQASWGTMIEEGRQHLSRAWWLFALPASGLVLSLVSLHHLADRLRDRLDPRHEAGSL